MKSQPINHRFADVVKSKSIPSSSKSSSQPLNNSPAAESQACMKKAIQSEIMSFNRRSCNVIVSWVERTPTRLTTSVSSRICAWLTWLLQSTYSQLKGSGSRKTGWFSRSWSSWKMRTSLLASCRLLEIFEPRLIHTLNNMCSSTNTWAMPNVKQLTRSVSKSVPANLDTPGPPPSHRLSGNQRRIWARLTRPPWISFLMIIFPLTFHQPVNDVRTELNPGHLTDVQQILINLMWDAAMWSSAMLIFGVLLKVSSTGSRIDKMLDFVVYNNIKVLALTETHLSDNVDDSEVCMNDFQFFRRDRKRRLGAGIGWRRWLLRLPWYTCSNFKGSFYWWLGNSLVIM